MFLDAKVSGSVPLRMAIFLSSAVALLATLALGRYDLQLASYQSVRLVSSRLAHGANPPEGAGNSSSEDFVSTLPPVTDPDRTYRFISRLADDRQVRIAHIQGKNLSTTGQALRRIQYDLQLHGDYVSVKSVLIEVLAKFPGMTLQRLKLHRNEGGASATPGDVDASVELVQLLAPPTAS